MGCLCISGKCKCCCKRKEEVLVPITFEEEPNDTIKIDNNNENRIIHQSENANAITATSNTDNKFPLMLCLSQYINEELEDINIFQSNLYRQDELNSNCFFSKRTIVSFLHSEFDIAKDSLYKEFHNGDGMQLCECKESPLSSSIPITRMLYKLPVSDFPSGTTVHQLAAYFTGSAKRREWDKGIKTYSIIQGDDCNGVLYICYNSPIKLISERDIVDKKADFYIGDEFYSFTSSTNDDLYPQVDGVIRAVDYFSISYIGREGDDFVFKSISQVDIKNSFAPLTKNLVPSKLKMWYSELKKAVENDNIS